MQVWVVFPPHTSNIAMTEVLYFSNLYRRVSVAIILATLESIVVHYIAVTMVLYLLVALLVISGTGYSDPVPQYYFFLSMKVLKV